MTSPATGRADGGGGRETAETAATPTFSQPVPDIPRDGRGRPLIIPVDGGDPIAYSRISSHGDAIDDKGGLVIWKQWLTAYGVAIRPDLQEVASAVGDYYDPLSWNKARMNAVVKDAMAAAQSSKAANRGTGLHAWLEAADHGRSLKRMPQRLRPFVSAYQEVLGDSEVIDTERFVVVDGLRIAGSYDHRRIWPGIAHLTDKPALSDLKTGKDAHKYAHQTAIQLACYANGLHYDHTTGTRTSFEVDKTVGLLIHLPFEGESAGECHVYALDLTKGWLMAQVASAVKAWRKSEIAREITKE